MKYGFGVPTRGPMANPQDISAIAAKGEELGFDTVFVNDHIVVPHDVDSRYPYSDSGEWPGGRSGEAMEQLVLLAYLARATDRMRLLTSVMVVPHRNPVTTAKMLATIDVLSEGRVTVGCGTGWMREEFEALGLPPFEKRGQVTNEYLGAMKALWTMDSPSFDGEFVKFGNLDSDPRPVQKPHPPIWIGGESPPALRRVVALGDGWYPIGRNPKFPMPTAEDFGKRVEVLHAMATQAGRDPATITLAFNIGMNDAMERKDASGTRMLISGSPEQRAADLNAFAAQGVTTTIVNFPTNDLNQTLDAMAEFAANVMPLAGG